MKHPLPRGWREFQIKDICSINYGKGLGKNNIVEGNIPVYSSGGIIGYHNESLINSKGVIIGRKGNAGSVFYSNSPFFCIDTAFYVEANDNIDLKFLYYKLISIKLERHKIDSAVPGINRDTIYSISITIPPLDEQKRIAEVLSLCDKLIENLTKLIEKKEIYKKGVMQRVLSGEVRFNGFTDEWETVRLGDIATITSAGVDKKINDNETKVRLLNYLDVFNRNKLYDNEISFITSANENQIKKCDIKKGDLFITPSSEDREGIAKSAVAMEDFTNVVYSYHIIRLRFNREIDLKFKSYMCDTALFHRQAYRLCDGSGQRYVISLGTFREMEIYIPKSVEEQKKIGELLSLIDQDIDNLKQLLHLRKLQKKGLMQKLLTGEVRI